MADSRDGHLELRPVQESDLDDLFAQNSDPQSVAMAAFTSENPGDRDLFDARMARLMASPDVTLRAITWHGRLVGSIASFDMDGQTEVTYWIERRSWGQGIATAALRLFAAQIPVRPLYARVASDNAGSRRVLEKAGFVPIGTETSFAAGRGTTIEETILRLGPESPATVDA